MNIKLGINLANRFLFDNLSKVIPIYLTFIFFTVVEILIDLFVPKQLDTLRIISQILVFIFLNFNTVLFLRLLKRDSKQGDFIYLIIPFLLYSVYYSFIALGGLLLFFIPGIIFYFIPIIATFSEQPPFKTSLKIFKKYKTVTVFLALMSLIIELVPFSFDYLFKDFYLSSIAKIGFDLFGVYFSLILTHMTVSLFYEYSDKAQGVELEETIEETVKI